MKIQSYKSVLAKLLAEENLLVEQRKVATAYFDVNTRTLTLPVFKEKVSNDVVDLFISHEVGHALETPQEGWMSSIKEVKKDILNVVEDFRIETYIKRKYPGLKAIHHKAYKELIENDFFGIADRNIKELNFIDRLNLFFKVGYIQDLDFNEEEQVFVEKFYTLSTFNDAVVLAKEIEKFIKQSYKENAKKFALTNIDLDDEQEEIDQDIEYDSYDESGGEESEEETQDQSSDEIDEELEELMESITDNYFKENQENLFEVDNREVIYVDIPDINIEKLIIPYNVIYSRLRNTNPILFDKSENKINLFKVENESIVGYLAKEFLIKKNASARKKSKESKSGDLNLNKIYSYRFNDDIFRRATKVYKEKNHSMVFFLDWSGSMHKFMQDTIKQLMCLVMFCKKINIPFEVYAFSSYYHDAENYYADKGVNQILERQREQGANTVILNNFRLMNLLSSKMKNQEFIDAANVLLSYYDGYAFTSADKKPRWESNFAVPSWFKLGDTPLNSTILLSGKIGDKIKKETKTDILNMIFLTDGESSNLKIFNGYTSSDVGRFYKTYFLRDKMRNVCKRLRIKNSISETNLCLDIAKESNDYRYFGFRVCGRNEFKRSVWTFFNGDSNLHWKEMRRNNCIKSDKTSFDEFYFILGNLINSDEEHMEDIDNNLTVNSIFKKFDKAVNSKFNNRIFLKKFISFIS